MIATTEERRVKFEAGFRLLMGAQHSVFLSMMLIAGCFISFAVSLVFPDLGIFWFNVMLVYIVLTVVFSLTWAFCHVYLPFGSYVHNSLLFGLAFAIITGCWIVIDARLTGEYDLIFWSLAVGVIAVIKSIDYSYYSYSR